MQTHKFRAQTIREPGIFPLESIFPKYYYWPRCPTRSPASRFGRAPRSTSLLSGFVPRKVPTPEMSVGGLGKSARYTANYIGHSNRDPPRPVHCAGRRQLCQPEVFTVGPDFTLTCAPRIMRIMLVSLAASHSEAPRDRALRVSFAVKQKP